MQILVQILKSLTETNTINIIQKKTRMHNEVVILLTYIIQWQSKNIHKPKTIGDERKK